MPSALETALAAALAVHGEARLDRLLAAWQGSRQPLIATLVAEHAATLDPVLGADPHDLDAWQAQAAQANARERGELLARIDTTKWPRALAQLEVVATWPADPRTVDTLLALVERAPYRSHPARAVWQRIYALLIELADPRALAALPRPGAYTRQFPRAETQRSMAARLTELRERLAALPEPAPLTEAEAAAIERLRPAAPDRAPIDEAQLLADVYANPDDDAPRAVYADLLTSRGDPRGELISLQLLPKPGKPQRDRVKQLLREHQMVWLGELADVALASDLRYVRGFPAALSLDGGASKAAIERLTGHPAWRTLHELDVRGDRPGYTAFLAHEVFFGLRELTTVSATALIGFVDPAPRKLSRIVVSGDFETYMLPDAIRAALLSGVGVPELRTLGLRYSTGAAPDGVQRVLASPLGQALTRIELSLVNYDEDVHRCLAAVLAAEAPNLGEIACLASFAYALTRTEAGWALRATYKAGSKPDRFPALTALLDSLREQGTLERLTRVELLTPRYQAEPDDLVRLRRAARGLELILPS